MQSNIKGKYQELRVKINKLMKGVEDSLTLDIEEVYLSTDSFLKRLEKIELTLHDQLDRLNTSKENKRLQIH